jgi:hypothetical protein
MSDLAQDIKDIEARLEQLRKDYEKEKQAKPAAKPQLIKTCPSGCGSTPVLTSNELNYGTAGPSCFTEEAACGKCGMRITAAQYVHGRMWP